MRSMVSSWSSVKPLSCEAGEGGAQCAPGEGPALREERPHPPLRGTPASAGAGSSPASGRRGRSVRSEEHTSELQSLMRISYAVFCLKKKKNTNPQRVGDTTTNRQD